MDLLTFMLSAEKIDTVMHFAAQVGGSCPLLLCSRPGAEHGSCMHLCLQLQTGSVLQQAVAATSAMRHSGCSAQHSGMHEWLPCSTIG